MLGCGKSMGRPKQRSEGGQLASRGHPVVLQQKRCDTGSIVLLFIHRFVMHGSMIVWTITGKHDPLFNVYASLTLNHHCISPIWSFLMSAHHMHYRPCIQNTTLMNLKRCLMMLSYMTSMLKQRMAALARRVEGLNYIESGIMHDIQLIVISIQYDYD